MQGADPFEIAGKAGTAGEVSKEDLRQIQSQRGYAAPQA